MEEAVWKMGNSPERACSVRKTALKAGVLGGGFEKNFRPARVIKGERSSELGERRSFRKPETVVATSRAAAEQRKVIAGRTGQPGK